MSKTTRAILVLGLLVGVVAIALLLTPATGAAPAAGDAVKGKAAFDRSCAGCHGEAGVGKVGPPIGKDVGYFVRAGVPAQVLTGLLAQSVRQRPPNARMPAFSTGNLSDAELDDIAAYLFSLTPAPTAPPRLGTAENGAKPFADNCAVCHGDKGQGGKGPPVAMMAGSFKQMGLAQNVMLGFVNLATRSGALPNMPTFAADKLSDEQAADVAAYIWSLAPATLPKTGQPVVPLAPLAAAGAGLLLAGGLVLRRRGRRP